jgi:anaerobic ribonucleoside-triphosphate reductase
MKDKNKRQECEIFQRTCGWMTARSNMNLGKIAEVLDRKMYKIKKQKKDE